MEKPLQLVYNNDGKLQLNPKALEVLQSIEVPMVAVAVVGAARTGKSYLMNCLAGDRKGFSVISTTEAHTKGIWMWCQPLPQRPNEVLLLLDTEGLGDPQKGDSDNDNSIYSLAVLLSSILIYNGQSKIDHRSLQDLHFVTELSKWIQMMSQPDGCDSWDFVRVFPEFVWAIRDLTLDLSVDGKVATPNEYLEHILKLKGSEIREQDKKYNELRRCIRNNFPSRCCFAFPFPTHPNNVGQLQELEDKDLDKAFVKERQNLINYVHNHAKVKRVLGGQLVTGRRFVELIKMYVGMMADGVLPCVESSVAKLAEVENQAAVDEALKFFDTEIKKFSESGSFTMSKLIDNYNMNSIEAFNIFHKRSMNNNSGKYIQQLEEKMSSAYMSLMVKIKEQSQVECEKHPKKVMSSIKGKLTSGHYLKPGGFQEPNKDLNKAKKGYERKTKNKMEGPEVEKPHLDHVQKMESRLRAEQMRASELEQELKRVKQEKENLEQRKKIFEECRNKEIMEQIRKRFEEDKTCSVDELKEAMNHMRSEKEKYEYEGRKEDAERAQQKYEYLKKKHEETEKRSFMGFLKKHAEIFHTMAKVVCAVIQCIISIVIR